MAAPINPAHGSQLPHSKLNSKTANDIRRRVTIKNAQLAELRRQRDEIAGEILRLMKTDTREQLAKEYGVSTSSIDRLLDYGSYFRR